MYRETKKAPPMRKPYQEIAKAEDAVEALLLAEQIKQLQRQNRKLSDDDARRYLKAEQYRLNTERRAAAEQMQADRIAQERRESDKDRELERLMAEVERLNSVQPDAAPVATESGKKARMMDRVNQVIENYIASRSGVRLAGEGLATALGAGLLYEYMDPEEVVQDPAAARQYQGSLN